MADMSQADTTYVDAMAVHQKSMLATSLAYLNAGPAERRANLSDQARTRLEMANECCCNGAGCCCCANGCCWDGPCGTCNAGCGCGKEQDPNAAATF